MYIWENKCGHSINKNEAKLSLFVFLSPILKKMDKEAFLLKKRITQKVNKTIFAGNLLANDDKIMVGLSGGKDSYSLLEILVDRRRALPFNYQLIACHIVAKDMDYEADLDFMTDFCRELGVTLIADEIEVGYTEASDKPACFVCSHKRRSRLFTLAQDNGCNKLALGHHLDDAIETLLMNMVFHSTIRSMPHTLSLCDGNITAIRPLSMVLDKELMEYAILRNFPKEKKRCPHANDTHRTTMRNIIDDIEKVYKDARISIYKSMSNINPEYLPTTNS